MSLGSPVAPIVVSGVASGVALATALIVALISAAMLPRAVGSLLERRGRPRPGRRAEAALAVLAAVALVAVAMRFAGTTRAPLALLLTWTLVAAAATDVAARLVPDPLSLGGTGATAVLIGVLALTERSFAPVTRAVAMTVAVLVIVGVTSALHRAITGARALGGGDRKLLPLVVLGTAAVSPRAAVLALTVAVLAAGTHAAVLLVRHRVARGATLPFAPHLAAGTIVALLVVGAP